MKNYIPILLLTFLFLYSCNNNDQSIQKFIEQRNRDYTENLSSYEKFIDVSHFPQTRTEFPIFGFSYTPLKDKKKKYNSFIPFKIVAFESFYEDTLSYLEKKSGLNLGYSHINATDSSVMKVVVCEYGKIEDNENLRKIINRNFTAGFPYPIPFLEDLTVDSSNVNALDSTYTVYVYKSEARRIVPKKYHLNPATGILPDKWAHGYSTGVAISDIQNKIVYWAVAW